MVVGCDIESPPACTSLPILKSMRSQSRPVARCAQQQQRDVPVVQHEERQRIAGIQHRILAMRNTCQPRTHRVDRWKGTQQLPHLVRQPVCRPARWQWHNRFADLVVSQIRTSEAGMVVEHRDRRMGARIAFDGVISPVIVGADEVEGCLAGQLQRSAIPAHPGLYFRYVEMCVIHLERRRLTAGMHGQRTVAKCAVSAVFGAGDEFLHNPRIISGDRQAVRIGRCFLHAGEW